jgi:hypothetical protein
VGKLALAEARGVADALRIKGEAEASYNARVALELPRFRRHPG